MKRYKNILFDVDGVLLDTMPIWDRSADRYMKDVWNIIVPEDMDAKCATMSLLEFGEYAKGLYPEIILKPKEIAKDIARYLGAQYVHANEMPGMVCCVRALKKQGYCLYLATASDADNVKGALSNLGVWECFNDIFTCTEIGYSKSYTHYYEEISKKIGVPCDELVMVEDSLYSASTAKRAGLYVVGIYEQASKENEKKMKELCDSYFYSLKDMLKSI